MDPFGVRLSLAAYPTLIVGAVLFVIANRL
jgi:hypothetical protein